MATEQILTKLTTNGFRILGDTEISFEPGLNILSGENATGKTSILEAIGYCLRGRSILGSKDSDVVSFDKNNFQINLGIKNPVKTNIKVVWTGRKRVFLGENPVRSAKELVKNFKLVFIRPNSVNMVLGSPSLRRDFLDDIASQINPEWAELISEYRATVKDRNALLSSDEFNPHLHDVLTSQVIKFGTELRQIRHLVADDIQEITKEKNVSIHIDDSKELSERAFENISRIESIRGTTMIGPHRDKCFFELSENRVEKFASTGEARRVTMILKLAGARVISVKSVVEPVILADDLLAELDEKNSELALSGLREFPQTILTNAGLNPKGEYNLIKAEKWQNR